MRNKKHEYFEVNNKQDDVTKIKGRYYRNKVSCDATKVYTGHTYLKDNEEVSFSIYEKYGASWDSPLDISYSIGWEINKGEFLLGLPTRRDDILALKKYIDKLVASYLNK